MQFTVTKTTTETFAVDAENASAAKEQFDKESGNQITLNSQISVQPRPNSPIRPAVPGTSASEQRGAPTMRVTATTTKP